MKGKKGFFTGAYRNLPPVGSLIWSTTVSKSHESVGRWYVHMLYICDGDDDDYDDDYDDDDGDADDDGCDKVWMMISMM